MSAKESQVGKEGKKERRGIEGGKEMGERGGARLLNVKLPFPEEHPDTPLEMSLASFSLAFIHLCVYVFTYLFLLSCFNDCAGNKRIPGGFTGRAEPGSRVRWKCGKMAHSARHWPKASRGKVGGKKTKNKREILAMQTQSNKPTPKKKKGGNSWDNAFECMEALQTCFPTHANVQ